MNKAVFLFFDNVMNVWLGDREASSDIIQKLFIEYQAIDPSTVFHSNEEMEKLRGELYGKDFYEMMVKMETMN